MNKTQFDELDKRTWNEIYKIKFKNSIYCKKLIADGNGNFSADFPEGTYYALVISNRTDYGSMSQAMGKFDCKKLVVKSGETINYDTKFKSY